VSKSRILHVPCTNLVLRMQGTAAMLVVEGIVVIVVGGKDGNEGTGAARLQHAHQARNVTDGA
jgi:hypothetical protein